MNEDLLTVWDVDNEPGSVLISVLEGDGVHLEDASGLKIHSFSFAQMLKNEIRVVHDGGSGTMERLVLSASDGIAESTPLTLEFTSVPVEIHLRTNTGLRLLHRSSAMISAANLSFYSNLIEMPLTYSIVAQPEFGVVECVDSVGDAHVCATFTQSFIDQNRLRYRHANDLRPRTDSFSFQVTSSNVSSRIHTFHINFIAVNVKIFNREAFLLNNTEEKTLHRDNLFAWTFPRSFPPPDLVYHVVEPPKYGILSRKLESNRKRRIGVSSNFSQQHIDEGLINYKLHFVQYSVVNDYFTFRLVTPAITSELVRFEITFVPGVGSIQLINRTVIVHEGQKISITNHSLLLETPDDSNFLFTIGVLPSYGNLVLTNKLGARFELGLGKNFSTSDITNGRLFYEHDGGESRMDKFYLVGESVYRGNSRIPFWMTVNVVLENDNPPYLRGSNRVYLVERGDRVLYPHLLPWADLDLDSEPLQFSFDDIFREVSILTQEIPQVPVRNFSERDLTEQKLVIRHTGTKEVIKLSYMVSDGKHRVRSELEVHTGAPFVRLEKNRIQLPQPKSGSWVSVGNANLSVTTNLDVDNSDIHFTVVDGSNFMSLVDGTMIVANSFTQKDIDAGLLSYSVEGKEGIERLLIRVADRTISGNVEIVNADKVFGLEVTTLSSLRVPLSSGIAQISSSTLSTSSNASGTTVTYIVITQPTKGSLLLEELHGEKRANVAISPSSYFVRHFTQKDIDRGLLQYLPTVKKPDSDFFTFNITNGLTTIGPFSLNIHLVDDEIDFKTANITVEWVSNTTIDSKAIRNIVSPQKQNVRIFAQKTPKYGKIVRVDGDHDETVESFGYDDVVAGKIFYVHGGNHVVGPNLDQITVKACVGERCSTEAQIYVQILKTNVHGPELVRNEILRLWNNANGTLLSNQFLSVHDSDTPAYQLVILVSNPLNGFVAKRSDLRRSVVNFTQKEIDDREIYFMCANGCSRSGGFSFLVSDGKFQIGPEWFAVESSRKVAVALEANNRLFVAPGERALIGHDLLKVNLPQVPPENVIYRIQRPPKHGIVLNTAVSSVAPVTSFTQADINARRIEYVQNRILRGWSTKDYFHFVVNSNQSEPINEEFRFRILVSYAALQQQKLARFVTTKGIVVGPGGSVTINQSYVDLASLENALQDSLLVDIYRTPRSGFLERTAPSRAAVLTADQLHSGRHLIYHNKGVDDTVLLHVYPKQNAKRKTDRLRIPLAITVDRNASPSIQIEEFPKSIKVVSGGRLVLDGTVFQTVHSAKKPSEIEYKLIQEGSNGIEVRFTGSAEPIQHFTQADINKGRVEFVHRSDAFGGFDDFDVLVFSVEGNTRALPVRIQPLSLSLVNHSVIAYVQGKTYIVLNRGHLGSNTNGDRSLVIYNVTRGPENGTFYWVAGEKEAKTFTQKNIDDGEVLYAQLNMNAYQDSFDFSVGNGNNESIESTSYIVVLPAIQTQKLVADDGKPLLVTISHLNATAFEGTAPRFLVIEPPEFGRFFYADNPNVSVNFFTFSDIAKRRLLYKASNVEEDKTDETLLEFRSDSLQPARLKFVIEVRASSPGSETIIPRGRPHPDPSEHSPIANQPPISHADTGPLNPMVPIGALLGVLAVTLFVLFCCRRRSSKDSDDEADPPPPKKASEVSDSALKARMDGTNLLDNTVYATIGRHRAESLGSKTPQVKAKFSHPATTSSFEPQPPACKVTPLGTAPSNVATSSVTFRKQLNSIGRSASQPRTPTHLHESQRNRAKLKEGQYWV
ncbi:hypothetical protein L596_008419 [Steinernema carpocapsae]|nr:hypothetical protein L596_008419 [Steinernema carpocapsae]